MPQVNWVKAPQTALMNFHKHALCHDDMKQSDRKRNIMKRFPVLQSTS